MRTLFTFLVVGSVASLTLASQGDAVKKEREKLQGTWKIVSSEEDARATPDFIVSALTIEIKGDQITLKGVEDLMERFGKVTFTIDPATTPRILDFKVTSGKEKGNQHEGIYVLKDDELKICVSTRPGGNRPDEFKTAADSNRALIVLKREKK